MKATPEHNARIAKITFASVYPHYVDKKGRMKELTTDKIQNGLSY